VGVRYVDDYGFIAEFLYFMDFGVFHMVSDDVLVTRFIGYYQLEQCYISETLWTIMDYRTP
jgi:hypothetical protein